MTEPFGPLIGRGDRFAAPQRARRNNLTPVSQTAAGRLARFMRQEDQPEYDEPVTLPGLDNPYGVGLAAYEPNTVLFADYEKAYNAVQDSKAAEADAQAEQVTVDFTDYAGGGVVEANGQVATMVAAAMDLAARNVPYVWGGTSRNGVDCSGLIYYAARAAGIDIPRVRAIDYGQMGTEVSLQQARPGDIVYIDNANTTTDHVGIYIGNGQMIQAPQSGDHVRVTPVGGYTSIRRIFNDGLYAASPTPSGATTYLYNGQPQNNRATAVSTARSVLGPLAGGFSSGPTRTFRDQRMEF